MRYRIKNWREYQHYKGRHPPWIKIHKSILTSDDWVMQADASKLLLIVCMLAAQIDKAADGTFNGDPMYLKKIACLDAVPDLEPLVTSEFLEVVVDASKPLAPRKQFETPSASVSVSKSVPVSLGGVGEISLDQRAAMLAVEFWNYMPGRSRPLLDDLTEHFKAKLVWLENNGRNEAERILVAIRDPKRDRALADSIGKMFKFWQPLGLEEERSNARKSVSSTPGHYTGLQAPSE